MRRAGRMHIVSVQLFTWAERPDLADRGPDSKDVWPEYNLHGDLHEDWWGPLLEELPEYQFALYDDDHRRGARGSAYRPVGMGRGRPLPSRRHRRRLDAHRGSATRRDTGRYVVRDGRGGLARRAPARARRGSAPGNARAGRSSDAPPAGGSRPALVEGPVPAHADRALHHLASRGRPAARSLDARA